MNKLSRVMCLGSVLTLAACGGPEQVEGEELARQSAAVVIPATASSQGCDFTLNAIQTLPAPPTYNVILTRNGGEGCPHPADVSTVMGTSYGSEPKLSMKGNALGLAVAFTLKGTYSGSSPTYLGLRHVDPATLSTVRSADIRGDYPYGQITSGGVSIQADGTTLKVQGYKSGTLQGLGGNYYVATFVNFFTSTTPPTFTTLNVPY
ncbi:hypothetical protein [Pyxidicoccus trucidator]|uniref:hypothetical protein n=1 Tax=Pyxidicoccus trucidator TaxID=2709662 RepID=UPI001967B4BB|nr:hypothetical protein [Pyxidicoccus trucidator]